MFSAIVIDTETTDKDPTTCEVIELAWQTLEQHPADLREAGGLYRFHPNAPSKFGAIATHHILHEELVGCLPSAGALKQVPLAEYWIGHNIDFDWKALGAPPVKRICTLAMSRAICGKADSHSLTSMMYYLFGANAETRKTVRGAHSAEHDVAMTHRIFHELLRIGDLPSASLAQIHAFSEDARVPKVMTFGKFLGQPISAVDRGYANWYRKQSDTDPYVIEAFRRQGLL